MTAAVPISYFGHILTQYSELVLVVCPQRRASAMVVAEIGEELPHCLKLWTFLCAQWAMAHMEWVFRTVVRKWGEAKLTWPLSGLHAGVASYESL